MEISYLESLPDEVLLQILSKISNQDLTPLTCTSIRIEKVCNDEPMWKRRYQQLGETWDSSNNCTWKKLCLATEAYMPGGIGYQKAAKSFNNLLRTNLFD